MNRRPGEGAPSWAQKGPENHAVQLATLPAQGASETEKKPESRYNTPTQDEAGENAIKDHPSQVGGWTGGREGPRFCAVATAAPLVGGRPSGGHPECLNGRAIERQTIKQLGE